MLARTPFEIKIAVLGNVSAGKTTLLNALFCDKYGEVSMKRTTAGINFFRLHTGLGGNDDVSYDSTESAAEANSPWSPSTASSAYSILKEITEDNYKLRSEGYAHILEKTFDIEVKQDLVPMRKDTKLVFVDIPGINEASTADKYKDYVTETWTSFDGVIVVMDARQGVNTEDQVSLLKFVKQHLKKKIIPVIVLCNKVDDPEDEEQAALVKEVRKEVETIFGSLCLEAALEEVLNPSCEPTNASQSQPFPQCPGFKFGVADSLAFISVSAINAFIHQSASIMSREAFNNFDKDLLEKLGREQVGRHRWNRLSEQEKRDEAFTVVKEGHQEGLETSNFVTLMKVLEYFFGGNARQKQIISLQFDTAFHSLKSRPLPRGGITSLCRRLYNQIYFDGVSHVKVADLGLVKRFWESFKLLEDEVFDNFEELFPEGIERLAEPMNELVRYHNEIVDLPEWDDTPANVNEKMKSVVQRYFALLLEKRKDSPSCGEIKHLSPHDWIAIWGSVLLPSYSKAFCQNFGQEKIIIESMLHEENTKRLLHYVNRKCPGCFQDVRIMTVTTSREVSEVLKCCTPCMIFYATKGHELRACPGCEKFHNKSQWSKDCCPSCRQTSQKIIIKTTKYDQVDTCSCDVKLTIFQTANVQITSNEPVDFCQKCAIVYPFKTINLKIVKTRPCLHCNLAQQSSSGPSFAVSSGGFSFGATANPSGTPVASEASVPWLGAGYKCPSCKKESHFQSAPFVDPTYNASGQLMPFPEHDGADFNVNITVPAQMSDSCHFAHIVWKYCDFVELRNGRSST